jgi:hypothetical protein
LPAEVDRFTESTCDFPPNYYQYCGLCEEYKDTPRKVNVELDTVIHKDNCDCGRKVSHFSGGNYHYTTWSVLDIRSGHLDSFVSSMLSLARADDDMQRLDDGDHDTVKDYLGFDPDCTKPGCCLN